MEFKYILFEVEQGVCTITLNRPDQMNSISPEVIKDLVEAIDLCADRNDIRAVILTGSGRAFSAGDDIKVMETMEGHTAAEIADIIENQGYPILMKKMIALPKPVLACVNGMCFGAAGEIALACDYIIASDKASFGQLYIKVATMGNTYLLPKTVGVRKALELLWTGRIISVEEALRLGIVNEVVEAEALTEKVRDMALRLASGPTVAIGLAKKTVYESLNMELEPALRLMCEIQGELAKTKDNKEGYTAFVEKRKPNFTGE